MAVSVDEKAVLAVVSRRFDGDGKLPQLPSDCRDSHKAVCEEDVLKIIRSWKEKNISEFI